MSSSQVLNRTLNKAKLIIQQGSDLVLTFDLVNFTASLGSATGRGQIRQTASSATVEASFTCVVDSGAKTMTATLAAADSSAMTLDASTGPERVITTWCYDIELVLVDGTVNRLIWGTCDIIPEVSQ